MRQADARILWNEENNKISELVVIEFICDCDGNWPMHWHKKYHFDTGNSCKNWDKRNAISILLEFGFGDGFIDRTVADKAFQEFCKIDEFKKDLYDAEKNFGLMYRLSFDSDDE